MTFKDFVSLKENVYYCSGRTKDGRCYEYHNVTASGGGELQSFNIEGKSYTFFPSDVLSALYIFAYEVKELGVDLSNVIRPQGARNYLGDLP
jgi:hypothetical protein